MNRLAANLRRPRISRLRPHLGLLAAGWMGLASLAPACAGGFDSTGGPGGDGAPWGLAAGGAAGTSSGSSGGSSGGTSGGSPSGSAGGSSGGSSSGSSGGSTAGSSGGTSSGSSGSATCQPIADFFANKMWTPVLSPVCSTCHGGVANFTLTANMAVADALTVTTAEAKKNDSAGKSLLLEKPIGQDSHQGGAPLTTSSDAYKNFAAFVAAVQAGKNCVTP